MVFDWKYLSTNFSSLESFEDFDDTELGIVLSLI